MGSPLRRLPLRDDGGRGRVPPVGDLLRLLTGRSFLVPWLTGAGVPALRQRVDAPR